MKMKTELIVALDVPDSSQISACVDALPESVRWYKVGLELFCAEGPRALAALHSRGKSIFLDLKLHDIPRTVERAVSAAAQHGVQLLTLHSAGGRAMLTAAANAARACGPSRPRLLAVTVLTSLDDRDFIDLGVTRSPSDQVLRLGELAIACGVDGLVCSPLEVARLRQALGPEPLLVAPGIRMADDAMGDQKRIGTPRQASLDGASHIVVGRPILEASDPAFAAQRMLSELALSPR